MRQQPRSPKLLDEAALWNYALKALRARALSASELRQKLARRAEPSVDIAQILSKLREYGYLDDQRFAAGYASARLNNQGLGKMRVLRDLRQRRVAPAVAERAVAETFAEVDELALIEQYLGRKYKSVKLSEYLAEPKNLAAAYRRLRYAGFSSANCIRVLKRFAAEAEELESLEE
jgi:regulatory protein